jgi:adenosylcobyric acid synthase
MEDSLGLDRAGGTGIAREESLGNEVLRVSVVRLPRISNFTDLDALAAEPGVLVRLATAPAELADADLVVIPGSRATVADLAWLRERGFAAVISGRASKGLPILGICGGYQMLAREIDDPVESGAGVVAGLGLLPVTVAFGPGKVLGRPTGSAYGGQVTGYEVHHGIASVGPGAEPFPGGCRVAGVWGTTWHGTLESDPFRRAFLTEVAALAGRDFTVAPGTDFAAVRQARLDTLGDLVADHLDTGALRALIEHGAPPGLPVIPPAGPSGAPEMA